MILCICASVYNGFLMYNLEKDVFFLCWLSFWSNVMVHFEVVVLDVTKPRIVARVSTLKKARSIARCMVYEHLFEYVMIWRTESKFYETLRRGHGPVVSVPDVVRPVDSDDDLLF